MQKMPSERGFRNDNFVALKIAGEYGDILIRRTKYTEVEAILKEVWERWKAALGEDRSLTLKAKLKYGETLVVLEKDLEAEVVPRVLWEKRDDLLKKDGYILNMGRKYGDILARLGHSLTAKDVLKGVGKALYQR